MTWDDVVGLARDLPGVEVGTSYGTPALRIRRAFLCRLRDNGETLAIRCDRDERPLLIESHPRELFLTPHYEGSPMVLVALPRASVALVRELLEDAWIERAPKRLVAAWRDEQEPSA